MTPETIPDDRSRWLALYVLCVGMLMIVLDVTVVNVALPAIQDDLGFTSSSLAWVVNAYLIAFGGLLLLAGRLGDLIGRRRIFMVGLAVFTGASLLCGLAQSQELLIAARFLQGAGGALTSAVILGMIVTMFPEPPGEQQQAAERDQVGVHDPGEARLREAEVLLDRRERHVHDRRVEDDHQHPDAEHYERDPAGPFALGTLAVVDRCDGGAHRKRLAAAAADPRVARRRVRGAAIRHPLPRVRCSTACESEIRCEVRTAHCSGTAATPTARHGQRCFSAFTGCSGRFRIAPVQKPSGGSADP